MKSFCVTYRRPAVVSIPLPSGLRQHPERLALRPLFVKWSAAYGVPATLIEAIAWQESGWQNDVTSSANAQGIGQLLPTHGELRERQPARTEPRPDCCQRQHPDDGPVLRLPADAAEGDQCVAVASYYQGFGALSARWCPAREPGLRAQCVHTFAPVSPDDHVVRIRPAGISATA